MPMFHTSKLTTSLCSVMMGYSMVVAPVFGADMEVVAKKTKIINGKEYVFTKYLDEKHDVRSMIQDRTGQRVSEKMVAGEQRRVIGKKLQAVLEQKERGLAYGDRVTVNIALNVEVSMVREAPQSGGGEIVQGRTLGSVLNGRQLSDAELQRQSKTEMSQLRSRHEQRMDQQKKQIMAWAKEHGFSQRADVEKAVKDGRTMVTIELSRSEIHDLVQSRDMKIAGIELYEAGEDDIAQAMLDTSVNPTALTNTNTRGSTIGVYMTESGCANETRITNYNRLSGSETDHSRNVGAIIRAVSPDSFLYCRGGAVLPTSIDLNGLRLFGIQIIPPLDPPIHIVTRSHSTNDNTDYTSLDREWDNFVYNENIAVFNSGGNTGNGTGNVRSPGKGLNVITVGNYDDATDTIWGSSPFVDPETGNEKPEVAAPGRSIAAGGFTMTGTSQSTPHAAAFAADMMSDPFRPWLRHRPYLLKANMLAGATDDIASNNSTSQLEKAGLGGIDFASAHLNGWYWYWSGNNNAFDSFASNDGNDDQYIEKKFYISNSWDKVRAVISWLNRGSYTYDHRNDTHPIGMDLDFRVYDPNGNYVGSSASWDNPYEKVEFTPTVSGNYTFKINRYANRDTASNLRLGMQVNLYDE
ncbi:MAG: S8 family serine peptidase [Nitrospirales bacterium]|nr:S8 family serine peptidase [Nitrospira sp.]MDR4501138.1 S8 family serine peptidase [Nitrospirales bacterium]